MDETRETDAGRTSKTAQPFSEGEDQSGRESPGMKEAPLDRPGAKGDPGKEREMGKTTQRQE